MSVDDLTAPSAPQDDHADSSHTAVRLSPSRSRLRQATVDPVPDRASSPAVKRPASELDDAGTAMDPPASEPTSSAAPPDRPIAPASEDLPSIDDQIAEVTALAIKPAQDGEKGYIVASRWLDRVKARASTGAKTSTSAKEALEGDIGPVDNSSLVADAAGSLGLLDEADRPFIPLRPDAVLGEDFEIFPQPAWDLIVRWHGLAPNTPVIVRFAHNTNPDGSLGAENILYECFPPLYTIAKLRNDSAGLAPQSLKEAQMPPFRTIASRSETFHHFLGRVKAQTGIDRQSKVRVWRIVNATQAPSRAETGMLSPDASRSASPAPVDDPAVAAAARPWQPQQLPVDLHTFLALGDGTEREALDVQDPTVNEKYNGHMDLAMAGLAGDATLILEERIGGPAGGEWLSDATARSASAKGISLSVTKNGVTTVQHKANKDSAARGSGRSSPAPSSSSLVTRARLRRDGRAIGVVGLSNLGNTCYMNSALQCLRSVEELTEYFRMGKYKAELNPSNPLSHNGEVAKSYAALLDMMYSPTASSSVTPRAFKNTIGRYGPSFSGYGQQDSQEFLGFLLDGLQEDLNRIHKKPYIENPDSTDAMVHDPEALRALADRCWEIYQARNDSVIADLFAGTYKSTVVCPVCDKVSFTFDPFNTLTLQLPIENAWSKTVFFFPLDAPPTQILVDMDKNGSIKGLKDFVAAKVKIDVQRLHAVEIYKCKVYKVYEDYASVSDSIQDGDDVAIFELADVPTNHPLPKRKPAKARSVYSVNYGRIEDDEPTPDWTSPLADKLLVPIFHRLPRDGSSRSNAHVLFAFPSYIVVRREEAFDYDTILRKVLQRVATMTTRDIFDEVEVEADAAAAADEDDMVVTTSEDADSSSGAPIKTDSSDGEEGFVDVSMRDAHEKSRSEPSATSQGSDRAPSRILNPKTYIPPQLRHMFDVRLFDQPGELVPTGWSTSLDEHRDYPRMDSRLAVPTADDAAGVGQSGVADEVDDASSDTADEELDEAESSNNRFPGATPQSDSESDEFPDDPATQAPRVVAGKRFGGGGLRSKQTHSKKGKRVGGAGQTPKTEPVAAGPLVRLGEGLVLDWSKEAHDALFGATGAGESMRGRPTWSDVEVMPDAELEQKRVLRSSRRKRGISLADCLNEFGKDEILSENDAWYCPRCKEHRRANKKMELWKCPDILIIHLKRFSASRGLRDKIDVMIDFPIDGLDLSGRVAMTEEGKSNMYDLFAVDNHYGGLGGGHYTAFARNFVDGGWFEYNDTMASKRSPELAVTAAAYLLFYRRRSEKALGGARLEQIMAEAQQEVETAASRSASPAGDGLGLGDSYRNGSSSGLGGVGAGRQAANGLAGGGRTMTDKMEEEGPFGPEMHDAGDGYGERMQVDEAVDTEYSEAEGLNPFTRPPTWSFDFQPAMNLKLTGATPSDDENLMDGASDKAADGSSVGSRASSARMKDFDDEDEEVARAGAAGDVGGAGVLDEMLVTGAGHGGIAGTGMSKRMIPGALDGDLDVQAPLLAEEDMDEPPVAEVHLEDGEALSKTD